MKPVARILIIAGSILVVAACASITAPRKETCVWVVTSGATGQPADSSWVCGE